MDGNWVCICCFECSAHRNTNKHPRARERARQLTHAYTHTHIHARYTGLGGSLITRPFQKIRPKYNEGDAPPWLAEREQSMEEFARVLRRNKEYVCGARTTLTTKARLFLCSPMHHFVVEC